jgi:hypothetical protein
MARAPVTALQQQGTSFGPRCVLHYLHKLVLRYLARAKLSCYTILDIIPDHGTRKIMQPAAYTKIYKNAHSKKEKSHARSVHMWMRLFPAPFRKKNIYIFFLLDFIYSTSFALQCYVGCFFLTALFWALFVKRKYPDFTPQNSVMLVSTPKWRTEIVLAATNVPDIGIYTEYPSKRH